MVCGCAPQVVLEVKGEAQLVNLSNKLQVWGGDEGARTHAAAPLRHRLRPQHGSPVRRAPSGTHSILHSQCTPAWAWHLRKITVCVCWGRGLQEAGILHKLWLEQPENYPTCLATKPYRRSEAGAHFKKLQLCKAALAK